MKMYKLLWRRIVGLSCLFLLGLFMITLNGVPRKMELVEEARQRPLTEPSLSLTKTSISNAISYVGGKLRLLVAYSAPNDPLSKDSKNNNYRYDDDFDIIGDEEGSYQADVDTGDDDDIENPNKTFRVGDFDYDDVVGNNTNLTLTLRVVKTTPVYRKKLLANFGNVNVATDSRSKPVVRDVMYWSNELENLYPKGMSDSEVISFLGATKKGRVSRVEPPTWNRCGRPKNQFVVFQDGTRACARYRSPHHYLVQGEVMSFYLSRLLGINNVPTVTLSSIDAGRQWKDQDVALALREAGWETNATIALIQWVDGLERDRMPILILKALKEGKTIHPTSDELRKLKTNQLIELMQWSDLILFDYVTGNYDRVASMQDAADRERKPSILSETIHNLVKSRQTRTIWLIDNESGLLDAYSLLYGPPNGGEGPITTTNNPSANRFVQFHRAMLRTMCVFRRSTVHRIAWLSQKTRPVRVLMDYLLKREPLFRRLPDVTRNSYFVSNFKKRLTEVRLHVEHCQKLSSSKIYS